MGMRILMPEDIYKRFKILCIYKDLSVPKQTAELIRKFVEVQEKNIEALRDK